MIFLQMGTAKLMERINEEANTTMRSSSQRQRMEGHVSVKSFSFYMWPKTLDHYGSEAC